MAKAAAGDVLGYSAPNVTCGDWHLIPELLW
jgi:hypothetical protein